MKQFQLNAMQNSRPLIILLFLAPLFFSCKKFLDAKPDKKIVISTTLQDAQALLDNYTIFNSYYPCLGDQSDDNIYLNADNLNSLDVTGINNYLWSADAINEFDWGEMYQIVLNATISLETVEKIPRDSSNYQLWNSVKGGALFYRAYSLYQVAEYYAGIYDSTTASGMPGIPLRNSTDANVISKRGTLEETWNQIVDSYKQAVYLLPITTTIPSRPTKAAAWAALARTYLSMNKFALAATAADSALNLQHNLIDFNSLDSTADDPFIRFNAEVIFPSNSNTAAQLDLSVYSIDTALYASYSENDLRRSMYYILNDSGGYGFKGNYDGDNYNGYFNGIAVDEVLLIRAECYARLGQVSKAMDDLNTLLVTRWKTGTFTPLTASDAKDALAIILKERRKELILRGTRWFDLRRLSSDPNFAVKPKRIVDGKEYDLAPNSSRYTFLIPRQVIDLTGMEQNVR